MLKLGMQRYHFFRTDPIRYRKFGGLADNDLIRNHCSFFYQCNLEFLYFSVLSRSSLFCVLNTIYKKDYYYLSLRKSIIIRKAPIQSAMRIPCAEWCAWSNTESQHAGCVVSRASFCARDVHCPLYWSLSYYNTFAQWKNFFPLRVHIVKKSSEGRDTDKYCIKSVC